ncbi:MAG TPA: tetratricopeptide repeat protein [Verrucomicrobiae bacterium]|nr:tetratricopeptide repeat protein [Verrucomicrobiae bacterium]
MRRRRIQVIFFVAVILLAGRVMGQEDPRDVERWFRFLLSRTDELRAQSDEMSGDTSPAAEKRFHAFERRLENDYKHFLNDHPKHTRAMVAYGDYLSDLGREEEAMTWWKKAITIDPKEAYAYNDIANYYGHNGRAADALKLYDKAIELVPTEPVFRFNWATTCVCFRNESKTVYGWTKDEIFQHSLGQFRKARDLDPQNFDLSTAYAETFYMMPKPDWEEAYAAWKYCLGQPLDDDQRQLVFMHLARVCIHLQRYQEAQEWTTKLPANSPLHRALERRITRGNQTNSTPTRTTVPTTSAPDPGARSTRP